MHSLAEYIGAQPSLEGDMVVSFAVDQDNRIIEQLEKLLGLEVVLDCKKYSPKRSLNCNAYFWKLCSLIGQKLGVDKDTIYLMQLSRYGVFEYIEVVKEAASRITGFYRYTEVDHEYKAMLPGGNYTDMVALRCYKGSSEYDSKEMSDLINGTVNDANDLGIETWTKEEIDNLVRNWEGR